MYIYNVLPFVPISNLIRSALFLAKSISLSDLIVVVFGLSLHLFFLFVHCQKRMIKYFGGNNITNMRMSGYENDILLGSVTFLYQNKRKKLCYINRKILHWLMR